MTKEETIQDIANVIYEFTLLNHAFCHIEAQKVYDKHIQPLNEKIQAQSLRIAKLEDDKGKLIARLCK